jgi:hypothetical protein
MRRDIKAVGSSPIPHCGTRVIEEPIRNFIGEVRKPGQAATIERYMMAVRDRFCIRYGSMGRDSS